MNLLKKNEHFNLHLQAAWNKYGEQAFEFSLIEEVSLLDLHLKETEWIQKMNTNNPRKGYNKREVVDSNRGIKMSEETRKRLSESHRGHKRTPETQEKISRAQMKPVCQYDLQGNLIKCYDSFKQAVKETGVHSSGLSAYFKGIIKQTGGYTWKK